MIKVKLYDINIHRNECTFRPYLWASDKFKEIGIEFTTGDSYDYAWIAQASFLNKNLPLQKSIDNGLEFLSTITGDYMLFDGQDSTSLIGAYEVFKKSNALLLFKTSLLKDRSLYKQGWESGRYYWGNGSYLLDDFDQHSDRIVLSGTNWLLTHWAGIKPQWYDINLNKPYDVAAMFSYPSTKENYEYQRRIDNYYDSFRKPLIDNINNLNYNIAKLDNGIKVSQKEYYNKMFNSKIILAPFGYGEMAPRDLEAAMFGSVLIKPDMSYIETKPNVFVDNETYVACKHDFSDLNEKIESLLGDPNKRSYIIQNLRSKFEEQMNPEKLVLHTYDIFKSLPCIQ